MPRARYYVVFVGREPGIYDEWPRCQAQVEGFSGAQFRSFPSAAAAQQAWMDAGGDPVPLDEPGAPAPDDSLELLDEGDLGEGGLLDGSAPLVGRETASPGARSSVASGEAGPPAGSIAVDAACSGNPGPMEYRGVDIDTGVQLFHVGPMQGTNNIGEFLAIVHGLAWLSQQGRRGPLYSDSTIAIGWVGRAAAKTTLPRNAATEQAWQLLARAQQWLRRAPYHAVEIRKWPTRRWGQIPADFGRK
jgi:ribonuclease HI